jgi:hypothetical protein
MKLQYDLKENLYWIYIEENENGIKHITTKKKISEAQSREVRVRKRDKKYLIIHKENNQQKHQHKLIKLSHQKI